VVTQTLPEGERSAVMFFSQQAGHEVGASVALAQTVGGTGYAAIGVPGLEQVWILRRDAGSVDWQFETNLSASGGSPGDRFGHSVALATAAGGGHVFLVVGAPQQTFLAGAAYVFFRNPANGLWSQTAQLQAPSAQFGDLFGSAVAFRSGASMAEDRIAVGASNRYSNADTTLEDRRGTVSLFKPGAVGFEHEGEVRFNGLLCAASATLCEGKQQAMGFGAALAFDASGLWIGAPNFEQSDGANVGRVYRAAYGSVLSDSQWWLRSLLSPGPLSSDCEADPNQWGRAGGRFGSALAPIVGGAAVGYPGRGCVLEVPPNTADPRLGEVRLIGLGFAVFGDGFESP
jgi:hypothetical protein